MVVRRILSRSIGDESSLPREAIFQTRCTIAEKVCSLVIDGGSCSNFVSQLVVEKLQLPTVPHQSPYVIEWLCEGKGISVSHKVLLTFSIGKIYVEEVWCDVLPMDVCHVLLGRPWLYDRRVIHDGYLNTYTFLYNNRKIILTSMQLSEGIINPSNMNESGIPYGPNQEVESNSESEPQSEEDFKLHHKEAELYLNTKLGMVRDSKELMQNWSLSGITGKSRAILLVYSIQSLGLNFLHDADDELNQVHMLIGLFFKSHAWVNQKVMIEKLERVVIPTKARPPPTPPPHDHSESLRTNFF